MRRKLQRRLLALALVLSVYPVFVLGFTWGHVSKSSFQGGRNGPLDAYRHALASAVVAHTLGTWAVNAATWLMEREDRDSNRMDRQNNRIGASIGARVGSFAAIEPTVRAAVSNGGVDMTNVESVTWLRKNRWSEGRFW
jgi:hypothetical protein